MRTRYTPPRDAENSTANPAPKSLQRHGLTTLADNLPPGAQVARFERDFALIFREELAAKFLLGEPLPAAVRHGAAAGAKGKGSSREKARCER